MILRDLMSPIPYTLSTLDSLRTVICYMQESRFDTVPVTDEQGFLMGVFTRKSLYQMLADNVSLEMPIAGYVKPDAIAYRYDLPDEEVEAIAKDSKVGTGIVIDEDGRVLGLFTKTDLIMLLFRKSQALKEQLVLAQWPLLDAAAVKRPAKSGNRARFTFEQIYTEDSILENLKNRARRAAKGSSTILLKGESGTGKELFAHAIHAESSRANGPFITLNCAAIPENLLEAEFFGYEAGAFTGADRKGKLGKFELANGGTLVLDEIADMSQALQAKLLRALQEKEFYRVGGTERFVVDVRIIAATNRALEEMVARGEFREDLFYRLNVIAFELPALRTRPGDILLLTEKYISELNSLLGTRISGIDSAVESLLLNYSWPGNVRELRNVLEMAMTYAEEGKIRVIDLPEQIRKITYSDCGYSLNIAMALTERETISQALRKAGGNKSAAAKLLGLSRSVLYEKLAKYGITY